MLEPHPKFYNTHISLRERDFFLSRYSLDQDPIFRDQRFKPPPGPPQERYYIMAYPDDNQPVLSAVAASICHHVNKENKVEDEEKLPPFSAYEFFYDFDPLEAGGDSPSYILFVLANGKLQQAMEKERAAKAKEPIPAGYTERPAAYPQLSDAGLWDEPVKPTVGVWRRDKDGQWVLDETIPSPFNERFHVFVQGGDWCFVTDSGKVWIAKKPEKEKGERKLESLWDNDKYPITAVIVDADADRVFLFGKAAKGDGLGKDFYWELGEEVRRHDYDPSAVKPVKTVEPLKSVMELAQFLVDEKQIGLKKK
jgi:hypothetical protein